MHPFTKFHESPFFRYVAYKQTNPQWDLGENITSLLEVMKSIVDFPPIWVSTVQVWCTEPPAPINGI